MKNRRIVLLDIGLDNRFDASMQFAQSLFSSINADSVDASVDVDFVRTRDRDTAFSTMTTSCSLLHVMAHGNAEDGPAFFSDDQRLGISLDELGTWGEECGRGISCAAIVADGCSTGTQRWHRAIRDCLQGNIAYVGTSRSVGWFDGTVFASAFYAALLRNRGRGVSPQQQAFDAAERAIQAFKDLTGQSSPFEVTTLTPSRKARSRFS